MLDYELLKILGVALGLGLLVGLQREYDQDKMAGIRTFSLVTLLGSVMGLLAQRLDSGIIIAAGALGIVILAAVVNYFRQQKAKPNVGQTTEVALLLMYSIGAYLVFGQLSIGVAMGATTAVLLHMKSTLGGMVDRLQAKDIRAIMLFAGISLVVLPVLPNHSFGPYGVFNPREIWMMVVLIVGLGLVGYFIYKMTDKNIGTLANGILGGLISSTATTVTFARRTKEVPKGSLLAAFIILVASTIAIVRIIIEISIVSPDSLGTVLPPLMATLLFMILLCVAFFRFNRSQEGSQLPEPENPAQLKGALVFGGLYAVILLAVAFAKEYFGESGLYIVSILSGLTDVDAITLSISNSMNRGEIGSTLSWRLILIAFLSNLLFKGGMASVLGERQLAKYIWLTFSACVLFGLVIIFVWPESWYF